MNRWKVNRNNLLEFLSCMVSYIPVIFIFAHADELHYSTLAWDFIIIQFPANCTLFYLYMEYNFNSVSVHFFESELKSWFGKNSLNDNCDIMPCLTSSVGCRNPFKSVPLVNNNNNNNNNNNTFFFIYRVTWFTHLSVPKVLFFSLHGSPSWNFSCPRSNSSYFFDLLNSRCFSMVPLRGIFHALVLIRIISLI